jgi:integrase
MENAMNFRQQAEQFMSEIATRTRPNTVHVYRSLLDSRILPAIGKVEMTEVGNKTAKLLRLRLTEGGLSPATINLAVGLAKQIVKSAVDEEGNQLYPRTWNNRFIGTPEVDPDSQNTPIASAGAINKAVGTTSGEVKALVALLAGTGLRIGECLALMVGPDDGVNSFWEPQTGTITIRSTFACGKIQPTPKTRAGKRTVDLDPQLNNFLKVEFASADGLLFRTGERTLRRQLEAQGIHGFHSMRRFRITHLQGASVPLPLIKFWAGHAASDVTERYTKMGTQIEERKTWSEKTGLGFQL